MMFFVAAFVLCGCSNKKRIMKVENSAIVLDDKQVVIVSGDFDYRRVPREYWEQRLALMAGMGLNTVTVRIPWMCHEPEENVFDFEGINDVRYFCEIAQKKNLLVWLHIGPYIGPDWDMGGLPWWLLAVDGIKPRSRQTAFMNRVERYFNALGKELSSSLLCNGGNIAMLQIEESVGIEKSDKAYLSELCELAKNAGFADVLTFTAATKDNFMQTSLDDVYFSLDIDSEKSAYENFVGINKFRYDAPSVCSSIGGFEKNVWGRGAETRNWDHVYMRTFELLQKDFAINISGVCGGSLFGASAGASMAGGIYRPYATSQNNDALITEWGTIKEKEYNKFRKTIFNYAHDGEKSYPDIEKNTSFVSLQEFEVEEVAPLFKNLPDPIESKKTMTMEQCGFGYGAVLYSVILPEIGNGFKLAVNDVHDYAQLFVNGKPFACIDRRNGNSQISLQPMAAGSRLDILVDATGRVSDVKGYKDYKGITKNVEIIASDGVAKELENWKIYSLPSDYSFVTSKKFEKNGNAAVPGYYRVTFEKPGNGDFFLHMANWGKGEVWINGHSLGRFWNVGPQSALYVPGCWIKEGSNELVIADWIGPVKPVLKGLDFPVL